MSNISARIAVDQFILDCSLMSLRLEWLRETGDEPPFAGSVEAAREEYEILLRRGDSLPAVRSDWPLIRLMLDVLRARLNYLERRACAG